MSINFSPYATNVLDYIGVLLVSKDGRQVIVRRSGMGFVVDVEGETPYYTDYNTSASALLNQLECSKAREE